MTGHFTSYENRTDHELGTPCPMGGAIGLAVCYFPSMTTPVPLIEDDEAGMKMLLARQ